MPLSLLRIAIELIENGDFETGDFTGWSVTDLPGGNGSWFIDGNDTLTPRGMRATVGAASGDYYAVSDQNGPGTHVLEQEFTVPLSAATVSLSFDMFVNDFSSLGPLFDALGLDHTGGLNQHARVDLLTATADSFDTTSGVVTTFFMGVDPQAANPNPYTNYTFDLTGIALPGETYRLRLAEVDNLFFLNQGVDNISVDFVPVPEPSTLILLGSAIFGLTSRRSLT